MGKRDSRHRTAAARHTPAPRQGTSSATAWAVLACRQQACLRKASHHCYWVEQAHRMYELQMGRKGTAGPAGSAGHRRHSKRSSARLKWGSVDHSCAIHAAECPWQEKTAGMHIDPSSPFKSWTMDSTPSPTPRLGVQLADAGRHKRAVAVPHDAGPAVAMPRQQRRRCAVARGRAAMQV